MKKILLVEDDILLNKTLTYNLTSDGYEVTSAYTFASAVNCLQKAEFHLALLDINLPDGCPAYRHLLCGALCNRGGLFCFGDSLLQKAIAGRPHQDNGIRLLTLAGAGFTVPAVFLNIYK